MRSTGCMSFSDRLNISRRSSVSLSPHCACASAAARAFSASACRALFFSRRIIASASASIPASTFISFSTSFGPIHPPRNFRIEIALRATPYRAASASMVSLPASTAARIAAQSGSLPWSIIPPI